MIMHYLGFVLSCSACMSHGSNIGASHERLRSNLRRQSSSQLKAVELTSLAGSSRNLNRFMPRDISPPSLSSVKSGWNSTRQARWHPSRSSREIALREAQRPGRHFPLIIMSNKKNIAPEPPEPPEDYQKAFEDGVELGRNISSKFLQPRIDDPGLPPSDALVSVNGAVIVAVIARLGIIPLPTWLKPLGAPSPLPFIGGGGLPYILPAVSHGSFLAACWVLGALASGAFESEAYMGTLREAISRTWKGGLFATGLLILSTQLYVSLQLVAQGIDPTDPSMVSDEIILRTVFEVATDVTVQALVLTAFRVFRWWDAQQYAKGPW